MTNQSDVKRFWRVVEFDIEPSQEDMVSWLMMQLGANGSQFELRENGKMLVRVTFEPENLPEGDIGKLSSSMDEYGLSPSISTLRTSTLDESDWLEEWKKGFVPFTVGARITICPAWLEDSVEPAMREGREIVLIEPGLAFGTGFHATTRFVLDKLQQYVSSAKYILDVGTGSGILCVAAAKLNATVPIMAVETDPLACRVARENFELNHVSNRVVLLEGSTEKVPAGETFDLILSNLTFEDNTALLPDYAKLARTGAHILFAGVLKEKRELMHEALKRNGFTLVDEEVGEMWLGLDAQK